MQTVSVLKRIHVALVIAESEAIADEAREINKG